MTRDLREHRTARHLDPRSRLLSVTTVADVLSDVDDVAAYDDVAAHLKVDLELASFQTRVRGQIKACKSTRREMQALRQRLQANMDASEDSSQ